MVYSRLFITICAGITLSSVMGLLAFFIPILNNLIGTLVILCATYIPAGMISIWANKEAPYLASSIAALCIGSFQYFFGVFFVAGELIYTPEIFAISLFIALVLGNLGTWIKRQMQSNRSDVYADAELH